MYIGPSTTALSYLNVPNIVAAIKATGAQAVSVSCAVRPPDVTK